MKHKGKRKKSAARSILLVLLTILAAGCIGAIIYLGRHMIMDKAPVVGKIDGLEEVAEDAQDEEVSQLIFSPTPTPTPIPTPLPEYIMAGDIKLHYGYHPKSNEQTISPAENELVSTNALLIDLSTDTIIVAKGAEERIYPASMTKILTNLVAAEQIQNLDETFTVTPEMTAYCLNNGCSAAGFVGGENVPIRDLFYGTILPSGGEAAAALASCAAGSHEAFVEMMNRKVTELGLDGTSHFTNCVGIHDENNYSTLIDMAMILKSAIQNDWAREVLSTKVHITTVTEQNPEGIVLSNWFLRRIEDKDCGGQVIAAKTGFVNESGVCAASYMVSSSGIPYICVTANAGNNWQSIYDHVALYKTYTK